MMVCNVLKGGFKGTLFRGFEPYGPPGRFERIRAAPGPSERAAKRGPCRALRPKGWGRSRWLASGIPCATMSHLMIPHLAGSKRQPAADSQMVPAFLAWFEADTRLQDEPLCEANVPWSRLVWNLPRSGISIAVQGQDWLNQSGSLSWGTQRRFGPIVV